MAHSDLVQSVAKALDILQFVASRPRGVRLAEIAAHLELKPPAVHNVLRTLISRNFVEKNLDGCYRIGAAAVALAQNGQREDFFQKAEQQLLRLASLFPNATFTLTELTQAAIVCRRRISPDRPGEIQLPQDRTFPPYVCVSGISAVIFSDWPPEDVERLWPFDEYAVPTWKSQEEFRLATNHFKENGYVEKITDSAYLLSVPVARNITLGISTQKLTESEAKHLRNEVLRTVRLVNEPAS